MAGAEAPLGARERRLLPELAHGPDGAGGHVAELLPGLDPSVLDFGLGGLSAEKHDAIRVRIDPRPHLRDMGYERVAAGDVVVRGEDGDRCCGIPPGDLRGRRQDGRGRPAVRGLSEDVRMRVPSELLRGVRGVLFHCDDDRPVDGKANSHPVQGLAEQRAAAEDRHVLLRPLIAEGGADQGPKTHALSPASTTAQKSVRRRPGVEVRCVAKVPSSRESPSSCSWLLSDLACGGRGTCRPRRVEATRMPGVGYCDERVATADLRGWGLSLAGALNFFRVGPSRMSGC